MAQVRLSALKNSVSVACLGIALSAAPALANPSGGQVSSGSATISNSSSSKIVVKQTSQGVVINWKSFDINKSETTQFVQPNANAVAINRIGSQNASQILGTLSANGKVVLINPNGIAFGKGSKVNVGALIATTTDGSDSDLLAGRFTKNGNQNASVTNAGRINAGGTVALVAPNVSNAGVVTAKIGSVSLGGTNKFTVDFSGDGLVSFAAGDAGKALVSNSGKITGTNVSMTARVAEGLATSVVNTSGIVTATGTKNIGGNITLDAGTGGSISVTGAKIIASGRSGGGNVTIGGWNDASVSLDKTSSIDASAIGKGNAGNVSVIAASATVKGSIKARGGKKTGNGGKIETSGDAVDFGGADIDAGAMHGTSGQWLLDPVDIAVDTAGAATISAALATSDVFLASEQDTTNPTQIIHANTSGYTTSSGPGNFYLLAPITWSSSHSLQIGASHSTYIYAPITVAGSGTLQILTNELNNGSGGILDIAAPITFSQPASGHLNINGLNFTLETSFASLVSDVNANPAGYFALANDVSAAGTTYTTAPITAVGLGSSGSSNINLGILDGLGHTISGLSVQTSGTDNAALIGTVYAAGTVENLHLDDVSITSTGTGIAAALAAVSNRYSIFTNDSSSGTVTSAGSAGGLLGETNGSTTLSWSSANVTGVSIGFQALPSAGVGGFAAWADSAAFITDSYATGDVTGFGLNTTPTSGGYLSIGGFLGLNWAFFINNDYATGNVLAENALSTLREGGFVGQNSLNVDHSYATGSVTAQGISSASSILVGGFAAQGSGGSVLDTVYASGHIDVASGANITVGGLQAGNPNVVKNSVWDADSTGVAVAVGSGPAAVNSASVNASTRTTPSAYTPFTFTPTPGTANAWVAVGGDGALNTGGGTRPMLAMEYSPIINNLHQLQLIAMNLGASSYYLNTDLDASQTGAMSDVWSTSGFVPLGSQAANAYFRGAFYGQGHTISDLTINSGLVFVGLFGIAFNVSDLTLDNLMVNSLASAGTNYAGALAGEAGGPIANVVVVGGAITGSTGSIVGGLVGENAGAISYSSSSAAVTGGLSSEVGGLAGDNSFFGGTISKSFATGAVNGSQGYYAGGLVGYNSGSSSSITDSFAMGDVMGGSITTAGGLVGGSSAAISNSYSTGTVTGAATMGGAIGQSSGTVSNVYWDKQTSGVSTDSSGATGETTAALQASLLTGLDDGDWSQVAGISFPYLTWILPSGTPDVVAAKIYSDHGVTGASGLDAHVLLNGGTPTALLAFTSTGADGYYYGLYAPGTVSGQLAVYSNTDQAATYLQNVSGSQTGIAVDRGYLRQISSATTLSAINAGYAAALGSVSLSIRNREIDDDLFNIDTAINQGTGNLILNSAYGDSQSAPIIAQGLLLLGGPFSNFTLTNTENMISTLAANGARISVTDSQALTVGTVFNSGIVASTSLTLKTTNGGIVFNSAVNSPSAQVTLDSAGTISAGSSGQITASYLGGSSVGGWILGNGNSIGSVSGLTNTGGGNIRIADTRSLSVGNIDAGAGSLTLSSGGTMNIFGRINAATKVVLTAAGSIQQGLGGIQTAILTGSAGTFAGFIGDYNAVGAVGGFTTAAGFNLTDTVGLGINGPLNAGSGEIDLEVLSGDLIIRDLLKTTTRMYLISDLGRVAETVNGGIVANELDVRAHTGIQLTSPNVFTYMYVDQTDSGPNKVVKAPA